MPKPCTSSNASPDMKEELSHWEILLSMAAVGGLTAHNLTVKVRGSDGALRAATGFIDALFFWQRGHCETAWHSKMKRLQLPPHMRGSTSYTAQGA